ncbi:MAG: cobalt ECF transporter T component CbiQ [Candidatus Omnitrophica bacterium]|nr:cobalt ECF transporter T component CbiQ [Candidatus Omnitrophota bacterium]
MRVNSFIERSVVSAFSFFRESVLCENYASKRGLLQILSPPIKTLFVFFLLLAVFFSKSIIFILAVYSLCILLSYLSSIELRFFLKRTLVFVPIFYLVIALPSLFNVFTPGEPIIIFKIFNLTLNITHQGLFSFSILFLRVLTSVSLCVLLITTTFKYELLKVLPIFGVPHIFVLIVGMSYRYIYFFVEMFQNTYLAIKSRVGFIPSIKKGQFLVGANIANFWHRSYNLYNDVYNAMLARGYYREVKLPRSAKPHFVDWAFLVIGIFILGLSLWQG